ncbi:F-box protein [Musa troglodytarum]|uniref:F-box protein n=1 Tax=Musa troglodytarum TaxID=320322 RepID=A0A9E7J8J2_9LILI|nr:F-box protein [Musa troglodytarum]
MYNKTPGWLPRFASATAEGSMLPEEVGEEEGEEEEEGRKGRRRTGFSINDNVDLLAEILGRLDGRSLGVAGCVCRLWSAVGRKDSVWEAVCHRHAAGGGGATRSVVAALGGYRRLYRLCIGPALDRLAGSDGAGLSLSLSLSLSLFSIDCYERLGGRQQQQQQSASLLFLCKPVDVS